MRVRVHREKLRSRLVKKVEKISGQNLFSCYQCGTCTAGCPMIASMDITPNQVMKKLQMGDESVMDCKTIWVCASCHTCSVRCPKEIDLATVMEALRLVYLRQNVNQVEPSQIPKEELEELPQIALVCSFRKMTR
jgi:heterodisulfide reductase subunit C